jgi:hypothetical protein
MTLNEAFGFLLKTAMPWWILVLSCGWAKALPKNIASWEMHEKHGLNKIQGGGFNDRLVGCGSFPCKSVKKESVYEL